MKYVVNKKFYTHAQSSITKHNSKFATFRFFETQENNLYSYIEVGVEDYLGVESSDLYKIAKDYKMEQLSIKVNDTTTLEGNDRGMLRLLNYKVMVMWELLAILTNKNAEDRALLEKVLNKTFEYKTKEDTISKLTFSELANAHTQGVSNLASLILGKEVGDLSLSMELTNENTENKGEGGGNQGGGNGETSGGSESGESGNGGANGSGANPSIEEDAQDKDIKNKFVFDLTNAGRYGVALAGVELFNGEEVYKVALDTEHYNASDGAKKQRLNKVLLTQGDKTYTAFIQSQSQSLGVARKPANAFKNIEGVTDGNNGGFVDQAGTRREEECITIKTNAPITKLKYALGWSEVGNSFASRNNTLKVYHYGELKQTIPSKIDCDIEGGV